MINTGVGCFGVFQSHPPQHGIEHEKTGTNHRVLTVSLLLLPLQTLNAADHQLSENEQQNEFDDEHSSWKTFAELFEKFQFLFDGILDVFESETVSGFFVELKRSIEVAEDRTDEGTIVFSIETIQ